MQSAVCARCSGGRIFSEALPSPHDLRDLPRTVREVPSSPVACRQESGGLRVNASRYHGSPSLEFPGTDKRRSVSGVSGEAESHKVPVKTYSPRRMRTLNAIRFHTGTTKNGTRLFTPADLDFRNSGRWSLEVGGRSLELQRNGRTNHMDVPRLVVECGKEPDRNRLARLQFRSTLYV